MSDGDCLTAMECFRFLDSPETQEPAWAAHIDRCPACQFRLEQLHESEARIHELAHEARPQLTPDRTEAAAAWKRLSADFWPIDSVFADVAGGALTLGRLLLLRWIIRPACGTNLATCAILQAARQTSAAQSDFKWNAFLKRLAELLAVICGETMGRIVLECGALI
jgi:hypothetical protein